MPFRNLIGFTLIELIIVIGVISVLAALALAYVNPLEQFKKVRDAQRIEEIRNIKTALERYFVEESWFPGYDQAYKATTALSSGTEPSFGGWIIEGREAGGVYSGFDASSVLTKIYIDPNLGGTAAGVDNEGKKRKLNYIFKTDGTGKFTLGALREAGDKFEIIEIGTVYGLITPSDFPEL